MSSSASPLPKPAAAEPFWLQETFVHLKDLGRAAPVAVGADFWETLEQREESLGGRLVGTCRLREDMSHWEMHPAGDELLMALSGEFELVLQDGRSDRVVELQAGQAALVPFGTWHRLRVQEEGEILFVTPCKGTERRAL